jgi:hypothetical protein
LRDQAVELVSETVLEVDRVYRRAHGVSFSFSPFGATIFEPDLRT